MSDDWGLADDYDTPGTIPAAFRDKLERQQINRELDMLFDEIHPGWRERKRLARVQADLLWHNQGLTYLPQNWRDMLAALGPALATLMGAHE